ncbi:acyl carrier protein [Sphingomonas daechungensis]|uniref:Acyl carrier protein n=1 Tax=Sphingomonas daechungensis TaxID=1176646 RepID=A0ABX6T0R5_9SPHN|nr:acyl carrier protein [Sphingomonas daechungensis]QNP43427.1 acyl carrier protein [Sphingomonas daechungensis]
MRTDVAKALIAEHLAIDLKSVRNEAPFSALGADSLDMVELAMRFENELNILIEDDESEACVTVGDALALLERKVQLA